MATNQWIGSGSGALATNPRNGNWGTKGNWSLNTVPAAGDDLTLAAAGSNGPYTLTVNTASTNAVDSLSIGSVPSVADTINIMNVNGTGAGAADTHTASSSRRMTVRS